MKRIIPKYDKAKIKYNTFNLSGTGKGIEIYEQWCSKYLSFGQIVFRGEGSNFFDRKTFLCAYNMRNGNLIGKII